MCITYQLFNEHVWLEVESFGLVCIKVISWFCLLGWRSGQGWGRLCEAVAGSSEEEQESSKMGHTKTHQVQTAQHKAHHGKTTTGSQGNVCQIQGPSGLTGHHSVGWQKHNDTSLNICFRCKDLHFLFSYPTILCLLMAWISITFLYFFGIRMLKEVVDNLEFTKNHYPLICIVIVIGYNKNEIYFQTIYVGFWIHT